MRPGGLRVGLAFDLREAHPLAPGMPPDRFAELDEESTIAAIERELVGLGHRVVRLGGFRQLVDRIGSGLGVDVVFNLAEGTMGRGREAQVPALLEAYGVPYTGSDPVALAITLDKALTKRLWLGAGLPTPAFRVLATPEDLDDPSEAFPRFVKPVAEGSSIGIDAGSLVRDAASLRARVAHLWAAYGQPALVEPFLPGPEYTVGIVDRDGTPAVLGVAQTAPAGRLRGFAEKRAAAGAEAPFRAVGDPRSVAELGDLALRAYRAVGCRDFARLDLRCDADGRPQLLEINALPGLAPARSAMAFLADRAGGGYPDLIATVLSGALRRRATAPR